MAECNVAKPTHFHWRIATCRPAIVSSWSDKREARPSLFRTSCNTAQRMVRQFQYHGHCPVRATFRAADVLRTTSSRQIMTQSPLSTHVHLQGTSATVACVAHAARHSESNLVQVVTGWEMRLSLAVVTRWRVSLARLTGFIQRNADVRTNENEIVSEKR